MENLAKVIMVTVQPGLIVPCVKVLRGVFVASQEQGATFNVALSFRYQSGTSMQEVTSSVQVSDLAFRQQLDPMWTRAQGTAVELPSQPNTGALIRCTAQLKINGIDCSFVEVTELPQTQG